MAGEGAGGALHPRGGAGRRGEGRPGAAGFGKGRRLDPLDAVCLDEILREALPAPRRDELIEALHLIQDAEGRLPVGLLHALAERMRLPLAEVYEVATFYAHFEVAEADAPPLAETTIRICDSLPCRMAGAERLIAEVEALGLAGVRVLRAPCMGACDRAPAAACGHAPLFHADAGAIVQALAHPPQPRADARDLAAYRAAGGYVALERLRSGVLTVEAALSALTEAGLRGLGGAGFPTGRKWALVRAEPGPRLLVVNADEGEPGTFKDRRVLEDDPHRLIEGLLIAAFCVEAQDAYVYVRDEYPLAREILARELEEARAAGLSCHVRVHLRRGAGAYVCGEESALIESLEGKRGLPRLRPPYVAQKGLFGRPTLVNNVETLAFVPEILTKGPAWFSGFGKNGAKGLRSYSVSGRVARPGVYVTHAGSTAREVIALAGGMAAGHRFLAYLPGGASGGMLPAALGDLPLEFGALEKYGCFVGSHALIVLSDQDDPKDAARNLMAFFRDESCGQCTPCRVGTEKALALMEREVWDEPLLEELAQTMRDASICGLGQAAANPLVSVMRRFSRMSGPSEEMER